MTLTREKILIEKIYPAYDVHLIPGASLLFDIYLTNIVTMNDV